MNNLFSLKTVDFIGVWVIGPTNNNIIEEKLGNCELELVLLLNKTKANDVFFHSTSHVNDSFYNCSL